MPDVASLSFDIDSSQAQRAIAVLETLKASSISMSQAATNQGTATANLTREYSQQRDQLDRLSQTTKSYDGTLQGLITRLDQMRRVMNDSRQGMAGYAQILTQAVSAATSLNTSVDALDRYIGRARQLGVQSNDLATGLERVTAALKNQTVAGNDTMRMLTQMGISTSGISANRPDMVLQQIAGQLRQYRMTGTSVAQMQQVLGPGFDAQAQMALASQPYQSMYAREQEQRQMQARTEIDNTMQQVQRITSDLQRNEARRQDLMGRYTLNPGVMGQLGVNPGGAMMSRDQQRAEYERIAALPAEQRGQYEKYGFQISKAVINNPISNAIRNYTSGTYDARQQEIDTRAEMESASSGWWGAQANRLGRRAMNRFGLYEPILTQDTRELSPNELRFLRGQSAGILAGYGDTALQNQVTGEDRLTDFNADKSLQDRYRKSYGDDEGNRRYALQGANLSLQAEYGKAPEQQTVDAAKREAMIMALPEEQRQQARYNLNFASQIGGPAAANLPVGTTLAGTTSRLSAGQAGAATTGFRGQLDSQMQRETEEMKRQILFQGDLTKSLEKGRSAAEDFTRAWNARNSAFLAGATAEQQARAEQDARNLTMAQRVTQATAGSVDTEHENRDKREQLELTKELNAANATAEERMIRTRQLSEQQQIRGGIEGGSLPDQSTPQGRAAIARRQAALQADTPAQKSAADMVGALKEQLQDVEAINDIMVRQGATMEQASRELEKQKTLNAAIAEAIRQGKLDEAAKLEALKGQTQELTRQQAMETQRGRNIDATTQNEAEAAFNRHVYSLPIDQQAGEMAKKGAWMENYNNQRTPATMAPSTIAPGTSPWMSNPAAQPYMGMLRVSAAKNNLPVEVLTQLIGGESGFRNVANETGPGGTSESTAGGLGQQIKGNPYLHGGSKWDPATSIEAAAEELAARIRRAGGDLGVAASGYGAAPAAASAVAAAGGQSFNPNQRLPGENDEQYAARMARDKSTDRLTRINQVGADTNAQREFENQQAAERRRARARIEGRFGDAELVYTPDLTLAPEERGNALRRQGQAGLAGQVDQAEGMTAATRRDIESLNAMAEAYRHGQATVDAATAAQQAHTEALQFSKGVLDEEARKRQLLEEKLAQEIVQTSQHNLEQSKEQAIQRGLNARGPFSDALDQRATERNLRTQQRFADTPGLEQSQAGQNELAGNAQQDAIDQQTRQMGELRDAAHSAEGSIVSALDAVVVRGEKGTDVLKGLTKSLEEIMFKALIAKPFEHMMDSLLTGGSPGGGGGGGGGGPGGGTGNPGDGSLTGLGGQLLKSFSGGGGSGTSNPGDGSPSSSDIGSRGTGAGLGNGSRPGGITLASSNPGSGGLFSQIFSHAGGLNGWAADKLSGPGWYENGGLIGNLFGGGSNTAGTWGGSDTLQVSDPGSPAAMGGVDAGTWDVPDAGMGSMASSVPDAGMMMGFAKGGILPGGVRNRSGYHSLIDFENQVVEAPTHFRFARGAALGTMGEAGPEAIMPLSRGPDGRLGIASGGGQTQGAAPTINFNIHTPDANSFRASQAQLHSRAGAQLNHTMMRNAL